MNENQSNQGNAVTTIALGFAVGALVGAGVALLLAPATGKDTRQRIVDTGRRLGNAARSGFDQSRDSINELKQDAKAAMAAGRESFERDRNSRDQHSVTRTEVKS